MEREMYRECMRNHAANLGTYATDGCGEYTSDPVSPGGLQCAACGCHRNFHRKVSGSGEGVGTGADSLMVAYSPSASAEERTSDGKRRTRTRFSAEQKEMMLRFAEKIGWRIPRREGDGGDEVARFCREIGVGRQVFKVWMHNHKNNNSSSPSSSTSTATATTTTTVTTAATTTTTTEANASSLTQ